MRVPFRRTKGQRHRRVRVATYAISASLDVPAGTPCDVRRGLTSTRIHSAASRRSPEKSPVSAARSWLCVPRDRARPESADPVARHEDLGPGERIASLRERASHRARRADGGTPEGGGSLSRARSRRIAALVAARLFFSASRNPNIKSGGRSIGTWRWAVSGAPESAWSAWSRRSQAGWRSPEVYSEPSSREARARGRQAQVERNRGSPNTASQSMTLRGAPGHTWWCVGRRVDGRIVRCIVRVKAAAHETPRAPTRFRRCTCMRPQKMID